MDADEARGFGWLFVSTTSWSFKPDTPATSDLSDIPLLCVFRVGPLCMAGRNDSGGNDRDGADAVSLVSGRVRWKLLSFLS